MADLLVEFRTTVHTTDSPPYRARAYGAPASDGTTRWHAWIEFTPVSGGALVRTGRETTQPNRMCAEYWATGLGAVYLRGALERALNPSLIPKMTTVAVRDAGALLRGGESRLRERLARFSRRRLVHTLLTYSTEDHDLDELRRMPAAALVDRVIAAVHKQLNNAAAANALPVRDDKTIIDLLEHLTGGISVIEGKVQVAEQIPEPEDDQEKRAPAAPSNQPLPGPPSGDRQKD